MSKREYLANESVQVTVTITNRAGRDIFLHGDGRQSWLDFMFKNERGVLLTPFRMDLGFKAVNLPAGRAVTKSVILSDFFRVSDLGRYGGNATVRMPDSSTIYSSNRIHFNVTKARAIYIQKVGVPDEKTTREYQVMTFNNDRKTHLYVQVEDGKTGRILRNFSLGESLQFRKPQFTVDGANTLHVLFLNTPSMFIHARVNYDGKLVGREYFKRGTTGDPRLITFANGEVKTAGGIPYDPAAVQAQRAKVRRLSERPPFTYR